MGLTMLTGYCIPGILLHIQNALYSEAYLGLCQTSKMESFAKHTILDVHRFLNMSFVFTNGIPYFLCKIEPKVIVAKTFNSHSEKIMTYLQIFHRFI